jgi:NAD(P)-dependent dehydrogenase (short-subunit alcohol dehydrogenase family)
VRAALRAALTKTTVADSSAKRCKTIVVVGASRGRRLAVAEHFVSRCDRLLAVSRTEAPFGEWIQAHLSEPFGIEMVATAVGHAPLDALLYMGRTW